MHLQYCRLIRIFIWWFLIVALTTKLTIKTCAQNLSATIPEHECNNRLRFVIEYCAYMLCKRNKTKQKKKAHDVHFPFSTCFVGHFFDGNISLQIENYMKTNTESDEPTQMIEGNMMETSEANPMFAHELI